MELLPTNTLQIVFKKYINLFKCFDIKNESNEKSYRKKQH